VPTRNHSVTASAAVTLERVTLSVLHRRLGHVSVDTVHSLIRHDSIEGIDLIDEGSSFTCVSCDYAKTTRKVIRPVREAPQSTAFGEEIHSDVWGPSPLNSIGGRRYYITFTDDYTRYTWIKTLKAKSEASAAYKDFVAWARTQHGAVIRRFRSDRGGEYMSKDLMGFLREQGTEQRLTTHDTPQHNGIAESLNRRLMERVRALLHHSGLPKTLWGEALHHATWLKNRSSTRILGIITPYERLNGHKPNIAGVPEWGQRVWVRNLKGNKLDVRGLLARWVGFDKESTHAHRVYWPEKHSLSVERDVRFTSDTVIVYTPSTTYPVSQSQVQAQPQAQVPQIQPAAAPSPKTAQPMQQPDANDPDAAVILDLPDDDVDDQGQAQGDDNVPLSLLTLIEQTPLPLPPPKAPCKPKLLLLLLGDLPCWSTHIPKPSSYMRHIASGEGTTGSSTRGSSRG
jgi:transposase InsO family protein